MNKNKITIITDLNERYKPIIEKLRFKHQQYLFYAFRNFNKTIKMYIKENNLSEEKIDKIRKWDSKNFIKI